MGRRANRSAPAGVVVAGAHSMEGMMFRTTAAALLAVTLSSPIARPEDRPWRPGAPALVTRGKDYLVHHLPPVGLGGGDAAFLHTTPSTGEMKVLVRLPTARFDVLGHVADRDRLYVAARSSVVYYAPGSGLPYAPEVRYHFHAFWLADGAELTHHEFKEADVPADLRTGKAVADGGPIARADDGARAFGQAFRFDGKKPLPAR